MPREHLKITFGHDRPLWNKGQRVATTEIIESLEVSINYFFKISHVD
jgi:hypothetical protein